MLREISAPVAFLLLTVSCLLSVAQGRELLGCNNYDNIYALSHTQEASDKIAELEAKYESLMLAFIDHKKAFVDKQDFDELQKAFVDHKRDFVDHKKAFVDKQDFDELQKAFVDHKRDFVDHKKDFVDQQQVVSNMQDIFNEPQQGQRLRLASINRDVVDSDTVRTIAEAVFAEQAPTIYDALTELNNTDAWQNATLSNLRLTNALQSIKINSVQASISTLTTEVDTNTASIKTIDNEISSLQTNVIAINSDIVNITNEVTVDEADIQTNSAAIALSDQKIQWNAGNITLLNETIQNSMIPSGLTDQVNINTAAIAYLTEEFGDVESLDATWAEGLSEKVDANTALISSLTSTVNSDADRITHLEGMELLEDHFYKQEISFFDSGETILGSFTVSAGNVLDFKASYECQKDLFTSIILLNDGEWVAGAQCEGVDHAGSMAIIYREHVSSDKTFEFQWWASDRGLIGTGLNFWGYQVYAGSTYNFIEG